MAGQICTPTEKVPPARILVLSVCPPVKFLGEMFGEMNGAKELQGRAEVRQTKTAADWLSNSPVRWAKLAAAKFGVGGGGGGGLSIKFILNGYGGGGGGGGSLVPLDQQR